MRVFLSIISVFILISLFLTGCTSADEKIGDPSDTVSGSEDQAEDPKTTGDPIDMEAFLTDLVEKNPNAGAEALCAEIVKNQYFVLFYPQSTMYFCSGLEYNYSLSDKGESYSVVDTHDGNVIIVVVPKDGIDPETLAKELEDNAMPGWNETDENRPDKVISKVIGGKVFLAIYHSDMTPVTVYASKARDYVKMFSDYLKEDPDAKCIDMAKFFAKYQKIAEMNPSEEEEGNLTGFGNFDENSKVTGFSDGASFRPMMMPSAFIGYVFKVKAGTDADEFAAKLRKNANPSWNICITVNTVIVEVEGDYVLFMMCNE